MNNKMRLAYCIALLFGSAQELLFAHGVEFQQERLIKSLEERAQEGRRICLQKTSKQEEGVGLMKPESRKAQDLEQSKLHFNSMKRDPVDAIVFGDYVLLGDRTGFGHLYTTSDLSYSHVLYTTTDLMNTFTVNDGTKVVALTSPDHGNYDVGDHIWRVVPALGSEKNNGDLVARGDIVEFYNVRNGFYLAESSREAPYNIKGCQVFGSEEESELSSWLVQDVTLTSNGELVPGESGVILTNVKSSRILASSNRIDSNIGDRYPVATRSFSVARRKRDMNVLFYIVRRATQQEIDDAIGL